MEDGQASRTALGAAGHRAAHQALEGGFLFKDPLAVPILGDDAEEALAAARAEPARRGLRLFIAMRSRFAEDCAHRAIEAGVQQILVLGAGLDTFAYRLGVAPGLRAFELDHPATQRDKRSRLANAGIAEPAHLTYVAHDFEHGGMTAGLAGAGLDVALRTVILWLGVTPYLTPETAFGTLAELARFPGGVEVVFDYASPTEAIRDERLRRHREVMTAAVAAAGEPFRGYFDSATVDSECRRLGYSDIEDLDVAALITRYLPNVSAPPTNGAGGHVARIATPLA